ncbi:hypothetical protein ACLG6S_02370 [Thermodesulfobacteriota bacterium B35]
MIRLIEYLQEHLRCVVWACYFLLAAIVVFASMVDRGHAHTAVERSIPFFWSIFGFVAAAVIIGIAYWYGRSGIMVDEDYYERPILEVDEDE